MKKHKAVAKNFGSRSLAAVAALLILLQTASVVQGQESEQGHLGIPIDWSSRHILFTNGASPEVAANSARDPRNWINWAQRSAWMLPHGSRFLLEPPLPGSPSGLDWNPPKHRIIVDWAMPLGSSAGMPLAESPAKYSFNVTGTPNCTKDFVVYTIGANPSSSQANIIAFNNLYTGTSSSSCPIPNQSPVTTDLTQPSVLWSYAAGSEGSALSPTLSLDGTKINFIETGTQDSVTNPAYFDVLTPTSGQGTSATKPEVLGAGSSLTRLNYTDSGVSGCGTGTTNSNSSPYIDYSNDAAYIGADNGILYRISPVFTGTSAPAVDFCITVNSGAKLTSPVYDEVSNQVFVSDGFSLYAYSVGTSSFTKTASVAIASTSASNGDPIILSPIVDATNGFVYVFSSADSTNKHSIAVQLNTSLSVLSTADIGEEGSGGTYIFDGDFSNAYFATGPKSGAGTLFACGTQSAAGNKPALYAMSFANTTGTMNSTPFIDGNENINNSGNSAGICSPLLDFFDGTTDRLFVGVGVLGNATSGANLVTDWTVSSLTSTTSTPAYSATNEWGGTSGFSIDNVSTEDQAASIYFGTLAAASSGSAPSCPSGQYCAIKLTQSALQ